MVKVVGVRFPNAGKLYYFDPDELWPTPGMYVIVETARGMELGEVVMPIHELDETQLTSPLKKLIRLATEEDVRHAEENRAAEKEALAICQRKVEEHQLDMKLVNAEITFNNSKILFNFTANGRVDFRSLVKDLASVFHTRIELHQIGARDEAKLIGGLGPCGRPICCASFLGDFQPVTIKMAKEQGLSLNPTKISGICGRLMCCLKYEEDDYEVTRKKMPHIGREVMTPDGAGQVVDVNILRETVRVRVQKGDSGELHDYPVADLQWRGRRPEEAEQPAEPQADAQAAVPEEAPAEPMEPRRPVRRERPAPRTETPVAENRRPEPPRTGETLAQSEQPEKPEKPEKPAQVSWRQALDQAKERASHRE